MVQWLIMASGRGQICHTGAAWRSKIFTYIMDFCLRMKAGDKLKMKKNAATTAATIAATAAATTAATTATIAAAKAAMTHDFRLERRLYLTRH